MTDAFEYRPKFIDIRVKKPDAEAPVHGPEPLAHPCDHIGCPLEGGHRAPKGRDHSNEYWRFCFDHAADYNRRWNYFSGMSEAELAEFQAGAEVGHRPTWTLRSGRGDRLSAATRGFPAGKGANGAPRAAAPRPRRRLTRLQSLALEALSLDEAAEAAQIRARYAEQVKRWHPDSNGGDRGAEANLQRVVHAYQVLKAGGLV